MITKFKTDKRKSILCCIVDNLELYQSGWAREVSINLSDFLICEFASRDFDIYVSKDEDALLKEAATDGYSHAVMIASGTSLGLSDRLFPAIEEECKNNFFISGHILDRSHHTYYKNACFELHHQFYIVNLKEFIELDYPSIGKEENTSYKQYEPLRSEECQYNDIEIPAWIKSGNQLRTYDTKLHGWNILKVALDNDKTLINVGKNIRNSKKYIYYEYEHVFTNMYSQLKHNQLLCNHFFAGWNSDVLKDSIPFEGPVEQYVTVGIGFNWIRNLYLLGFNKCTTVIFTDINYNCLMFMKSMVEDWDGKHYADFYKQKIPMVLNGSMSISDSYIDQVADQWDTFLDLFEDWELVWKQIKELTYNFVLIDYTAIYNFDWLESNKKTLINLSNLFNHGPYIYTLPLKYRIACENKLLSKLQQKDPNITLMLTSRAADGYWRGPNRQLVGSVSSFEMTDLSKLKKLPWHITDWNNSGSKPLGVD
jgi:hypothetical protein